ncbi:MAG: sigma-70 family RNA polymerase sigma factor [Deferribacteres bacterium]|nr:sigma-70 family RNA polymerase sigma factor [candidate division KSB1 bacterium]MCB9508671.1 sigma-70 family RNA polymerase sigma factor [Deferribacteres bacterium]
MQSAQNEPAAAEAHLVAALRDGDRQAFRKLVDQFQHPVYNLAFKILWNREDAEDVLQETFFKIIKSVADFRGDSSLATWVYKIATNNALMKLRERSKKQGKLSEIQDIDVQDIAPTHLTPEASDPFDELLKTESTEILQKAIEQLPEHYRGAFVLKDVEQLPTEEVAYILGIGTEALYSRLKRARMFLRDAVLAAYREKKEVPHAVS